MNISRVKKALVHANQRELTSIISYAEGRISLLDERMEEARRETAWLKVAKAAKGASL